MENQPQNQTQERTVEERDARASLGMKELLEEALAEAKNLARIEVALAKDEALSELHALHASYVSFLVCAACGVVGIAALVTSIVMVTSFVVGFVAGGVLIAAAVSAGYAGYKRIPVHPMEKTRRRLVHESHDIQERLA
jgi:hypothetical protein